MTKWIFEPGHTEAQFKARHMMVTWVRGFFKDMYGSLESREIIEAQRHRLLTMHGDGKINDDVLRRIERELDLEDSRLEL